MWKIEFIGGSSVLVDKISATLLFKLKIRRKTLFVPLVSHRYQKIVMVNPDNICHFQEV